MSPGASDAAQTRLESYRWVVIFSLLLSAALLYSFGLPRLRSWLTPRLHRVHVVSASLGDDVARHSPREVVPGTPVTLFAVVEAYGSNGEGPSYYGPLERAQLEGETAPVVEVHPWKEFWNDLEILWFKVEPRRPFFNEDGSEGFRPVDVEYRETLMASWGFSQRHAADVTPTGDAYPRWRVGTMRFRARAVLRDHRDRVLGQVLSPGAEAVHAVEPADRPHRVTVRGEEDALLRLRGYGGLPYVPLSPEAARSAVGSYIGGTVLAFWIGAVRQQAGTGLPFFGWRQLPARARTVVDEMFLAKDGSYYYTDDPLRPVTYDTVETGDLLAIEDHVGVLLEDRGPDGAPDGVLNRWDRSLEAYFEPLRETALGDAFVSGITVYRLGTGAGKPTPGRGR